MNQGFDYKQSEAILTESLDHTATADSRVESHSCSGQTILEEAMQFWEDL